MFCQRRSLFESGIRILDSGIRLGLRSSNLERVGVDFFLGSGLRSSNVERVGVVLFLGSGFLLGMSRSCRLVLSMAGAVLLFRGAVLLFCTVYSASVCFREVPLF